MQRALRRRDISFDQVSLVVIGSWAERMLVRPARVLRRIAVGIGGIGMAQPEKYLSIKKY
jgi:hypothetical protein